MKILSIIILSLMIFTSGCSYIIDYAKDIGKWGFTEDAIKAREAELRAWLKSLELKAQAEAAATEAARAKADAEKAEATATNVLQAN